VIVNYFKVIYDFSFLLHTFCLKRVFCAEVAAHSRVLKIQDVLFQHTLRSALAAHEKHLRVFCTDVALHFIVLKMNFDQSCLHSSILPEVRERFTISVLT
jgi:hypothetical protein